MATPSWLVGAQAARVHSEAGDLLACGPGAALLLSFRPEGEVEWHDVGEGWSAALYGQAEPDLYRRPTPWCLPTEVEDGRGQSWHVPMILSPLGTPAIDMAARLMPDGTWSQAPATPAADRAVRACQAALPFVRTGTLHEVELGQQCAWMCATLEATHYLNAATIGKLELITGTLRLHGLRVACGII